MKREYWDAIGKYSLNLSVILLILAVVEAFTSGPVTLHVVLAGVAFLISIGCMFGGIRAEEREEADR